MRTHRWIALLAVALLACLAMSIPTQRALADDTWLVAAELKSDPTPQIVSAPNPLTFSRPAPVESDWLVSLNTNFVEPSPVPLGPQHERPTGNALDLLCRAYPYEDAFEASKRYGYTIIVCVDQTYETISREQKRAESERKLFAVVRPDGTNPRMVAGVHEVNAQATAQQAATTSAFECLNGRCRRR